MTPGSGNLLSSLKLRLGTGFYRIVVLKPPRFVCSPIYGGFLKWHFWQGSLTILLRGRDLEPYPGKAWENQRINGHSRILKWRYCIYHIRPYFVGYIPLHRPEKWALYMVGTSILGSWNGQWRNGWLAHRSKKPHAPGPRSKPRPRPRKPSTALTRVVFGCAAR